jgi:hypothetical protein
MLFLTASAYASVMYQSTQYEPNYVPFGDDGTPARPPGDHLGNTIAFAGTERNLDSAVIELFNNTGVTQTFTLAIYAGADPNSGALLGNDSQSVLPTSAPDAFVSFNFGGLLVSDTITFILNASSGSNFGAGPYSNSAAPAIGSGPNSLWYGTAPGGFALDSKWAINDGATTNFLNAQFNASVTPQELATVPEPATSTLLLGAACLLAAFTVRKARPQPALNRVPVRVVQKW